LEPASKAAVILAILVVSLAGCRTASKLGLPVSHGNHGLLKGADQARRLAGNAPRLPTELAKVALPSHRIEAGDVLVVEPSDFNCPVRFPSDQTVQQDGTIDLGSYGRLQVVGKTIEDIQGEIQLAVARVESDKRQRTTRLASHRPDHDDFDPAVDADVSVRLVSREGGAYYVMGDVNAPGAYSLNGHETVLDALIAAGGLCSRANDRKIILTRPCHDGQPLILPVRYQQIVQLGEVSTNYQLLPGDRIYVPSLTLWEDIKQTLHLTGDSETATKRD